MPSRHAPFRRCCHYATGTEDPDLLSTRPTFDTAMDRAGPQEQQEWKLKGADDWGRLRRRRHGGKTKRETALRNLPFRRACSCLSKWSESRFQYPINSTRGNARNPCSTVIFWSLAVIPTRSCQKFSKQICLCCLAQSIGIIFIIQTVEAI